MERALIAGDDFFTGRVLVVLFVTARHDPVVSSWPFYHKAEIRR
jgi:hypothetical protein